MHEFQEHERAQMWFKNLQKSLKTKLHALRVRNDSKSHTIEDTAFLRGEISIIKELLQDMEEKTKPEVARRGNPYN